MSHRFIYQYSKTIASFNFLNENEIMSEQTTLSIKYFYIYNDSFGNVEGEEDQKIMYFFPPKVNIDEKMKNVGLSEAIIKFTETFNSIRVCESLHTEKTRHYYYKPEPDFYLVMVVNVPTETTIEGTKFHGEEVQDSVCMAIVRQAYHMYRLFHNTLTNTLESSSRDTTRLKQKLELFFNTYLDGLNLQSCDIMDIFQGVKFLPLDKQTFLHIQCFVNLLEASFPIVEFTSFFYNDSLIWSGLEPEDMQVVYHYLVFNLLSKEESLVDSNVYNGVLQTTPICSYGRFITGPENVHSNTNSVGKVPRVFLSQTKPLPAMYHLVVYRLGNCVVCLFIPESEQLTMEIFRKWDTFLGPRLTKLVPEVSAFTSLQSSPATTSVETINRFVYFNRMNLATKSTIHSRHTSQVAVSPQVLRILADINAQHARWAEAGSSSAETIVKTTTDHWVVGKLSNAREFYVVIQQKNANLIEISDEVKRISESELKNIYFHV